ncbi:hypothetical protein Bca52824_022578 [Brassica carinata]|uniref:Uncharacterized protein n=1 Tax=Brassica carinata TaxID=52824 RepID=A0A8X7VGT5_BRACI|nr:hypothetical protein Bca52824_022578 [Brassica carinata]
MIQKEMSTNPPTYCISRLASGTNTPEHLCRKRGGAKTLLVEMQRSLSQVCVLISLLSLCPLMAKVCVSNASNTQWKRLDFGAYFSNLRTLSPCALDLKPLLTSAFGVQTACPSAFRCRRAFSSQLRFLFASPTFLCSLRFVSEFGLASVVGLLRLFTRIGGSGGGLASPGAETRCCGAGRAALLTGVSSVFFSSLVVQRSCGITGRGGARCFAVGCPGENSDELSKTGTLDNEHKDTVSEI